MEGKRPFKVIIVGGSIAGLALANMLERLNVDFVVLEAYKEIAPQLGASITIWPHLARILDQIGWDALKSLVDTQSNTGFYRNQQAETLFEIHGMADILERRHGYPVIFIQRQMLVQALYNNLQHKDKIVMQKRLVDIQFLKTSVRAITKDGNTYTGDIIVGADGMHSAVRKQMHLLGNTSSPGSFDRGEYSKVPCTYKCIFGIARAPLGVEKGTTHIVMGKNYSHSIMSGPKGKVFFFLNVREKEVTHGHAVPRYSKEDERALAEQHLEDLINEHNKFGDIYKERIVSGLTPLHEYQWKRWYFGRIMTIGDACHKMHPISGNGGAAAVEDAAVLVNALHRKLQHTKHPSTEELQNIFAGTQRIREKRTSGLIEQSTKMQQLDAMESIFSPLIVRYVLPNLTGDAFFSPVSTNVVQGPRCDFLPVPERDRYVPFDDELPSKPLGHFHVGTAIFIFLYALLFYLAWVPWSESVSWAMPQHLGQHEHRLTTNTTDCLPDSPTPTEETVLPMVLVAPVIVMWTIETSRLGNKQSLGSWPVTSLIIMALYALKLEKLLPIYLGIAFCNSRRVPYSLTSGRPVPLPVIKAANTVMGVVYGGLAMVLCIPMCSQTSEGHISPLWRSLPVFVSALVHLLATAPVLKKQSQRGSSNRGSETDYMQPYFDQDYKPLTTLYEALIVLSFVSSLFIPWSSLDNHGLISANLIAQCLQIAFDLRRLGYITNMEALGAASSIILGQNTVGTVPTYIGSWYWRESVIHKLSK